MPETKSERLRRERQAGLDYLWPYFERLKQIIKELPEPKADPKNPTYPGRRKLAHQKVLEDLQVVIERVAGDKKAEWHLSGIMNLLRKFLPLDKEWQQVHVRNFPLKEEQQIIIEENARMEDESVQRHGRAKQIIGCSPRLQELLADRKDPERYVNDVIRKYYEK